MSEDYIIVHKPSAPSKNEPASRTPKRTPRRKSVLTVQRTDNNIHTIERMFNIIVDTLEEAKTSIQKDLLESLYVDTVGYFNEYKEKRDSQRSIKTINSIFSIIPTITLFTGINTQDHAGLCDNLCKKLETNFTKFIFYINEKNCQNMKSLLYSLFFQLEAKNEAFEKKKASNTFRSFFDLIESEKEYQDENSSTALIFIFKQFELINKDIIESFISIMSCYVEKFSIFFIIELASQSGVVNEQLTGGTISKLCIHKLYSMSASDFLDKYFKKVFIDNLIPFKLSGEILSYLTDFYKNYNFSISHFIHALKYCIFDHIQSDALNLPFIYDESNDIELLERLLNDYKSESILTDKIQKQLFNKSETQVENIIIGFETIRTEWTQFHYQYGIMVHLLFEILKHFPSEKSEKTFKTNSFTDFYIQLGCLSSTNKTFTDCEQFVNLKKLLQLSSETTLSDIIRGFIPILYATGNAESISKEFLEEIHCVLDICHTISRTEIEDNDDEIQTPVKTTRRSMSTRRSLVDQSNLMDTTIASTQTPVKRRGGAKTPAKPNTLAGFRAKFIEWLNTMCSNYFDDDYCTSTEYSKYFCYNDLDNLKQRLYDNQRINIHEALINPSKYIFHTDTELSSKVKDEKYNLPLSVIYKIYLECGHMINLFDWLQSFVDRMENADLSDLDQAKRKYLQALFFRSVTELQFMGYIKQTSRKVDHVVKLTNISFNPNE